MKRIALLAAAGLALAGCGWDHHPSSSTPRRHYPVIVHYPDVLAFHGSRTGLPRESAEIVSPTRLGIVTLGSSSCPSVPDELVVESPHRIRIHLTVGSWLEGRIIAHPPAGGACTEDYGTTPMLVTIDPKEIDVHGQVTVRFFYENSKTPILRTAAPL